MLVSHILVDKGPLHLQPHAMPTASHDLVLFCFFPTWKTAIGSYVLGLTSTQPQLLTASRSSEAKLGSLCSRGSSTQSQETTLSPTYPTCQASSHLCHKFLCLYSEENTSSYHCNQPLTPTNSPSNSPLPWNHLQVCTHVPDLCRDHTHS